MKKKKNINKFKKKYKKFLDFYKKNSNNKFKFPKIIMQTGYSKTNNTIYSNKVRMMNPDYKYVYYNDNDCINYLKKNFSQPTY